MDNLNSKWHKKTWSYFIGAIFLSLLQIITLIFTKNPWGITTAITNWSGWIFEALGGDISNWEYFKDETVRKTFENFFLKDPGTLRNIGIILGAFLSALIASQFRVKKIKSYKQILTAIFGGFLMGYGSSIASGCNIGAFYSSISSLSLSGWVFAFFLFLGSIIGGKLLIKIFM